MKKPRDPLFVSLAKALPFPAKSGNLSAMSISFDERMARYLFQRPAIHSTAFVAPSASIIGHVTLEEGSSVWFQSVLRADINRIHIGPRSNIQDGAVVHLDNDHPTVVGELVTVGHKTILHACTLEDEVLVGMGAIILDGAEIGARSIIGAGALVTGGKKIPPGSLVLGSPGKVVKTLDQEEQQKIRHWALKYVELSKYYRQRAETATAR